MNIMITFKAKSMYFSEVTAFGSNGLIVLVISLSIGDTHTQGFSC